MSAAAAAPTLVDELPRDLRAASGGIVKGDTADSRRYSALGDAVTVSVAFWIGERLASTGNGTPEAVTSEAVPATEGKRPSGG